jgi:hypothetical protein
MCVIERCLFASYDNGRIVNTSVPLSVSLRLFALFRSPFRFVCCLIGVFSFVHSPPGAAPRALHFHEASACASAVCWSVFAVRSSLFPSLFSPSPPSSAISPPASLRAPPRPLSHPNPLPAVCLVRRVTRVVDRTLTLPICWHIWLVFANSLCKLSPLSLILSASHAKMFGCRRARGIGCTVPRARIGLALAYSFTFRPSLFSPVIRLCVALFLTFCCVWARFSASALCLLWSFSLCSVRFVLPVARVCSARSLTAKQNNKPRSSLTTDYSTRSLVLC